MVSIGTWQFTAVVPSEKRIRDMHRLLETMRVNDLLDQRDGMEDFEAPEALRFDLEQIKATTTKGEPLLKARTSDPHLALDPGNFVFAGVHNLGPLGVRVAFTQIMEPDTEDWFWPLTGVVDWNEDKLVDGIDVGDHIIVSLPYQPGLSVPATLIVPTREDAGQPCMWMSQDEIKRIGQRTFMPQTWVLETLVKGHLPQH